MKTFLSFLTLCVVAALPAFGDETAEAKARAAAEKWLALVDAGKFDESWSAAASAFKSAVTQEQWNGAAGGVRTPLGKLVSRKLKDAKFTKSLPGAPDGEYVVIQFDTSFENKKTAVETVTPMLEKGGEWKVSGYFIK